MKPLISFLLGSLLIASALYLWVDIASVLLAGVALFFLSFVFLGGRS